MIKLRTLIMLVVVAGLVVVAVSATSLVASARPRTSRLNADTRSHLTADYAADSGPPASSMSPLKPDIVASAGQDEALLAKTELRIGQSSANAGASSANPRLDDIDKRPAAATAIATATPKAAPKAAPSQGEFAVATALANAQPKVLPTPTPPPFTPLTLIPCSLQTLWRSVNSLTETQIQFSNKSSQALKLYELNFAGNQDYRGDVAPGDQVTVDTYVTHPWMVTDASGNCRGVYSPKNEPGLVVIN